MGAANYCKNLVSLCKNRRFLFVVRDSVGLFLCPLQTKPRAPCRDESDDEIILLYPPQRHILFYFVISLLLLLSMEWSYPVQGPDTLTCKSSHNDSAIATCYGRGSCSPYIWNGEYWCDKLFKSSLWSLRQPRRPGAHPSPFLSFSSP